MFEIIDWQRPWLAPFRSLGRRILQAPGEWRAALNAEAVRLNLKNHRQLPIRFIPQRCVPPGVPYELFISETGCVPTRENLHDFYNALVWLTYPGIKIKLNSIQVSEIARATVSGNANARRGMVRDAATIFDENAALMLTSEPQLVEILRAHEWSTLFIRHREQFRAQCELRLFGHALMEKLVAPYKAITAHVWPVIVSSVFFEMPEQRKRDVVMNQVAPHLEYELAMSHFARLPVLGVPDWSLGQDEVFYSDKAVFRPKKL